MLILNQLFISVSKALTLDLGYKNVERSYFLTYYLIMDCKESRTFVFRGWLNDYPRTYLVNKNERRRAGQWGCRII